MYGCSDLAATGFQEATSANPTPDVCFRVTIDRLLLKSSHFVSTQN
jgi:hypothetical protein